jgi:acyl dehydratase
MKADTTTTARGERPPRYDSVELGLALGPAVLTVDRHLVDSYCFAVDADRPAPAGGTAVPPTVLVNELLLLYYYQYRQRDCAAVHTREVLRLHHQPLIGDEVTVTGTHVDRYVRRGRGHVVTESVARTGAGVLVASHRAEEIMDGVDAAPRRTGPVDFPFAVGHSTRKVARFDQVCVFSNIAKRQVNIHNDVRFARERGFGDPVVQGMQQVCYLAELGRSVFGAQFWTRGVVDVAFVRPLFADEAVDVACAAVEVDAHTGIARAACAARTVEGHRLTTIGSLALDPPN